MSQNATAVSVSILCFLSLSAAAQSSPSSASRTTASPGEASQPYEGPTPGGRWGMSVSLDYSYVSAGDITFQGVKGSSDAQSVNAYINARIPINDRWFVPVGASSRNLFLGTVANAPIPNQIETLGFDAGLGCHLNDQWTIAGSVGPRFYRLDGVDGDDLGVGGMVRAMWRWKPNFALVFGVGFESQSEVPVLPAAGFRWNIRTNLTLNLMWPRPALIYRLDKRLDVFVGGGGNFAVFRTDSNLGDKIGQPAIDNALGTYRDFHIGVGTEYRPWRGISVGVEAGYSVGREIDYTRLNQTVSFANSPYLQAGVTCRF